MVDLTTRWHTSGVEVQAVQGWAQCAICRRRESDTIVSLQEYLELPVPQRTWLLCRRCAAAILVEIERVALQTPLRVRIAVGIVAARRESQRHPTIFDREYWEQMPAEQLDTLVVCFVLFVFLMPPLVFLLIEVLTTSGISGP